MTVLKHTPHFRVQDAMDLAEKFYGIRGSAVPLPSERDQNFLLETADGAKFVLKISNAADDRSLLNAQNETLLYLSKHMSLCPRIVLSKDSESAVEIQSTEGSSHLVRLVHYLEGIPLAKVHWRSPSLLRDLGRSVALLDRALAGFDHRALHRDFYWDLANGLQIVQEYGPFIDDPSMLDLVFKTAEDFSRTTAPRLSSLRRSIIHNDVNDFNVLTGGGTDPFTRNQQIAGIIDFGDMVYSYTVSDAAIAITYAMLNDPDPLDTASRVIQGYYHEYPLTEEEIGCLFSLIRLRMCMSICIAARQQKERPEDQYLSISQKDVRKVLPMLARIHPKFAEAKFRKACGLAVLPHSMAVSDWLRKEQTTFASVLDLDLRTEPFIVFDFSAGNPLLRGDEAENTEPQLTDRLWQEMRSANVRAGIGRYDEARFIYTSALFGASTAGKERRTVHLGIDLFAEAGTRVFAPVAGEVYAFANNAAPQDYGPVIILKHATDDAHTFYTLYGHLSTESLNGLFKGKKVSAGDRLASIGTPEVNGGWSPHLHFQIINELLDLDCDFPGVCRASERDVWCAFSPDPNLIVNLPANRFTPTEANPEQTLATRKKVIGMNVRLSYHEPVKIVRGWMQYLYDENSRKYLDAYNNVPHVGHCHPRVVEAAEQQMRILSTNSRYLHDLINRYAEKLSSQLPDPLNVCFFVNSGSEANELAIRLARAHTKQRDMIVLDAAYHGMTTTLIDISPYKHNGPGGEGTPDWVHITPLADPYRGPYKHNDPQAGEKYAHDVSEIIENLKKRKKGVAAFIAESCPSVGGQLLFPPGYLANVYDHVRNAGGVCIADEVQTAYGRMGTHFWGFEIQNVIPDIVVLGKPIGNGHPIGAVVTTPEIAASFDNGMEFFSTFGGNTVSCAIGLTVLEIVLEERLQEHALIAGTHMLNGLRQLIDRYPIVGDVRGSGLFLGVEMVRNRATLEPATEEASFVANRMRELGILLGTDGPYQNVLKIRPPMPFSKDDADLLVSNLDLVLSGL